MAGRKNRTIRSFVLFPAAFVCVNVVNRLLATRFLAEIVFSQVSNPALSAAVSIMVRSFVFYLVPQFSLLPFTSTVEMLRIANRMLGYEAYRWRIASDSGLKICSSFSTLQGPAMTPSRAPPTERLPVQTSVRSGLTSRLATL